MAHSPLEEASRTLAVGRKRKSPTELWAAYEGPPDYVDKRQRLEQNDDYVPLDDDEDDDDDDEDDRFGEGGSISRRESKESGEISTSASGSRRSSDQSGRDALDLPIQQNRKASVVKARVTPIEDEPEIAAARRPVGCPKKLSDIQDKAFRNHIKRRTLAEPTASIEELVEACSAPLQQLRKRALLQVRDWQLEPNVPIFPGSALATVRSTGDANTAAPLIAKELSQRQFSREMTWDDVPADKHPKLAEAAKSLLDSGTRGNILEALVFFVGNGQFSKQARKCLDQYARTAPSNAARWPPIGSTGAPSNGNEGANRPALAAEQIGTRRSSKDSEQGKGRYNLRPARRPSEDGEVVKDDDGLASEAILGTRNAVKAAQDHDANKQARKMAKKLAKSKDKTKPNVAGTVEELEALYADPAKFSRKMKLSEVPGLELQKFVKAVRGGSDALAGATIESTLLSMARMTKPEKRQKLACRYLKKFAKRYYTPVDEDKPIKSSASSNAYVGYTQLFVSNLADETTDEQLKAFFQGHNILFATIKMDAPRESSLGHGLVTFATAGGAQRAIDQLHGKMLLGRTISLRIERGDAKNAATPQTQSGATSCGDHSSEQYDDLVMLDQEDERSEMNVSGDGSDEDEASVGEAPDASINDYGGLARAAASADGNASAPATYVRLLEISEEDQQLQYRYFAISDPVAYVRCLSCGIEGHMEDDCPAHTCEHCGALDQHFSAACPAYSKCSRCRRRGHDARTCTNRSVESGAVAGDVCDVCGDVGHVEEECSGLWRTYKAEEANTVKVPAQEMQTACYNCGADDHWGDDCPGLPAFLRRKLGNNKTWSARHANRFVNVDMAEDIHSGNGDYGSYGGGGGGGAQAYQLAQFDDMRD
ncbi:hypothetical protein LTR36_007916 [Oleoguttula mirabilis]|uniref:Uncharacterized protein n=1 Tax=Oleoguttula mirabilis TaxID=1507867 RepID=A0AAV9J9N2_9PEZI|nr:hypothetical protein LTR36_007916 [Oleoguttula mirabilis]